MDVPFRINLFIDFTTRGIGVCGPRHSKLNRLSTDLFLTGSTTSLDILFTTVGSSPDTFYWMAIGY